MICEVASSEQPPIVTSNDIGPLFSKYGNALLAYLLHTIGYQWREDAEDLLQIVFMKAYKALASGQQIPSAAVSAWLYKIAGHTAIDFLRRKRLISWMPIAILDPESGTSDGQYREEVIYQLAERSGATRAYESFEDQVLDQDFIKTIFEQLSPKYAICLWLFEHEGLSCAEIGQELGITPSAVKMRLMRARRLVTEQWSFSGEPMPVIVERTS